MPWSPSLLAPPRTQALAKERKLGSKQKHDEALNVQLPDPKREVAERQTVLHQSAV